MKKFVICIKELIVFLVCSIYDKCTWKVFRDILKCKSKLFAGSWLETFSISHTSIFSMKLYFIKSGICAAHEL